MRGKLGERQCGANFGWRRTGRRCWSCGRRRGASVITLSVHSLKKLVPLTISRGTKTHSTVFWLRWTEEGVEGWGEMGPLAIDARPQTEEVLQAAFAAAKGWLDGASAWDRLAIERRLLAEGAPSALVAGVNLALYDWLGKRLGQPVWRLLGLSAEPGPLTSVTIGIAAPAAAAERARQWLAAGDVRAFKIKLGAPAGAAADRAMFEAVQAVLPAGGFTGGSRATWWRGWRSAAWRRRPRRMGGCFP